MKIVLLIAFLFTVLLAYSKEFKVLKIEERDLISRKIINKQIDIPITINLVDDKAFEITYKDNGDLLFIQESWIEEDGICWFVAQDIDKKYFTAILKRIDSRYYILYIDGANSRISYDLELKK